MRLLVTRIIDTHHERTWLDLNERVTCATGRVAGDCLKPLSHMSIVFTLHTVLLCIMAVNTKSTHFQALSFPHLGHAIPP